MCKKIPKVRKPMFEIGFWELVVVGVVALWVLGPSRLPAVARVVFKWLHRAKNSFQSIKSEFEQEFQKTANDIEALKKLDLETHSTKQSITPTKSD
jgi:sec-independent protein translocase protein TatB